MATTLKIKQGDTVQMLSGKDRGKQGRVLEARPRDEQGDRREPEPDEAAPEAAPDARCLAHGRHADGARRDHRPPVRRLGVERDARLPDLQAADPRSATASRKRRAATQIKVRVCKRDGCGQEIDK